MGRLFCVDKILQLKPKRILEIGGGCTTFFDQSYGTKGRVLDDRKWRFCPGTVF